MDYSEMQKRLGQVLRAWRQKSDLSQEELAWRAGLHRSYVADIERGARNASLQSIEKLCRALQMSFSTFFEPFGDFPGPGFLERKKRPLEILLIDHHAEANEATMQTFRQAKLYNSVHVARDGAAAWEYLWGLSPTAPTPVERSPHLILLELGVPKVTGLEILRRLKQDERGRSIPVIVLTDSLARPDVLESRKLGAEFALCKPVDIHHFWMLLPKLNCCWRMYYHSEEIGNQNAV